MEIQFQAEESKALICFIEVNFDLSFELYNYLA